MQPRNPRSDLFPPFDANHAGYMDVGEGHPYAHPDEVPCTNIGDSVAGVSVITYSDPTQYKTASTISVSCMDTDASTAQPVRYQLADPNTGLKLIQLEAPT